MNLIFIYLFPFLLSNIFGHVIENGNEKSKILREIALKSENNIISLNATGFRYFVMETPRPYDLVLFYTGPNCDFCEKMIIEYKLTSKMYAN